MNKQKSYLTGPKNNHLQAVIQGIDKDVERGEDILMLGLGLVMLSALFAPIAPPSVLLPLVAVTFAISASVASITYFNMERKLLLSMEVIDHRDQMVLKPIAAVFSEHPTEDLSISFNPIKNLKRTVKSTLGGLLINPFWMPIFYMMGIQIGEEKKLGVLNLAIIGVEQKIAPKLTEN
jgi:hypothetical protein